MVNRSIIIGLLLSFVVSITFMASTLLAAQDGGYNVASELWAKAILKTPTTDVTLIWREVGSDTTPSGDTVVSGYFYADPNDFAYGSQYNPELFVKIYIATNGWCNIAFNHVTVDDVTVSSAHNYNGAADMTGSVTLNDRLEEHQYNLWDEQDGGHIPKPGTWSGIAGFGEIDFIVTSDRTGIEYIRIFFIDFKCDNATLNGAITFSRFSQPWAINDGKFEAELQISQEKEITIKGTFADTDNSVTGSYESNFNGTICTGTWDASP